MTNRERVKKVNEGIYAAINMNAEMSAQEALLLVVCILSDIAISAADIADALHGGQEDDND